jgi:hypothetical protein
MPTDPTTPSVSAISGANSAAPPTSPTEAELLPPPSVAGEDPDFSYSSVARRDFLKVAGASAGAFLVGGANLGGAKPKVTPAPHVPFVRSGESPDVVVVGAGAWGGWTALDLRKMGAKVTIVDAYGAGNARSTSGDETRGVRSSYGDRPGELGEVWMLWAREAMKKWIQFDDEWGRELRLNLFHVTGDLIMRTEWDNFQLRCKVWWDKNKIPYQVLNPDDVRKSFPVISMDDITAVLYEPDAGVVRARRACQSVAAVFEHLGGKIVIGRASPGKAVNDGSPNSSSTPAPRCERTRSSTRSARGLERHSRSTSRRRRAFRWDTSATSARRSATIGLPIRTCRATTSQA